MNEQLKHILLVDDEEGIRKVLGIFLADMGYTVHAAEDAATALTIFKKVCPPIVITDIKMPGKDGISLLQEIKGINPETEVIMVTGHGDMELAIKSLKLNAADFVTKPIQNELLEIALLHAEEKISMRQQLSAYTENLELLVAEKTKELIASERMATIGQTVAGLSHAIKNIAGGLKGGGFVLEKGLSLDNKKYLMDGWQMIKGNVEKITHLSMDLLNYSKTADIQFSLCDPNQPVRDVLRLMTPLAEENSITLLTELDEGLKPFYFDPEGIQRCLLNFVVNAIDACIDAKSPSSIVSIKTTFVDGWGVEYQVRDNGCGMDDDIQAKLFNEFFSTKGTRGTGLGLMITQKIIDTHHGEISVTSKKGEGTLLMMRLPGFHEETSGKSNT
jgi:signal transduction histidine kinase